MTVVVIDGFDLYNGVGVNTGLQAKWSGLIAPSGGAGSSTLSMITGRFGGQGLRITTVNGAFAIVVGTQRVLPSTYSSMAVGIAYRINDLTRVHATTPYILQFREGSTYHVHIGVNSSGAIQAWRASSSSAGTLLGSSANGIILTNTWQYVEAEVVISDTVGRVTVYVDGVSVLNLTGQDTRNGGTGLIDTLNVVGSQNSATVLHDFDDLYFNDTATALGERRVETLRPAADTAQKDFTPNSGTSNFNRVFDTVCDGDTTYVQSSTVGNKDLYTIGPLSSTPLTIDAVQLTVFMEKTDATTRTVAASMTSGATVSDGSAFSIASSYGKFDRIVLLDPNTSLAWTASGVNNLLIGPKLVS